MLNSFEVSSSVIHILIGVGPCELVETMDLQGILIYMWFYNMIIQAMELLPKLLSRGFTGLKQRIDVINL